MRLRYNRRLTGNTLKVCLSKYIILVISLFLWVGSVEATTYYVDESLPGGCTNGSTTYTPTGSGSCSGGSATIYDNLEDGFAALGTSDDLDIREGVYYTGDLNLQTGVSGTSGDRIVISNYLTEGVYITTSELISDPSDTSAWVEQSTRLYRDTRTALTKYRLFWTPNTGSIDDIDNIRMGYFRDWHWSDLDEEGEDARCSSCGAYPTSHWFYTGSGKTMADYKIWGVQYGAWDATNEDPLTRTEQKMIVLFSDEHDYVTFDGITFFANYDGMNVSATSDYFTISNCNFLGMIANKDRTSPITYTTYGMVIRGDNALFDSNYVRETYGYWLNAYQTFTPSTDDFVVSNNLFERFFSGAVNTAGTNRMIISNNEFRHYSASPFYSPYITAPEDCEAIGHTPASGSFKDLTVEYNYIHDADSSLGPTLASWGIDSTTYYNSVPYPDRAFGFYCSNKYANQIDGFIVRYNVFENIKYTSLYMGGEPHVDETTSFNDIEIYGNVFISDDGSIAKDCCYTDSEKWHRMYPSGISFYGNTGSVVMNSYITNLNIYNNSFFNMSQSISVGNSSSVSISECNGSCNIAGNIFSMNDLDTYIWDVAAFYFRRPGLASDFNSDYNIFYHPTNSPGATIVYDAGTYRTLAGWRTAQSEDANSLEVDPEYENPTAGVLTLSATSPAIDVAGVDTEIGVSYDDILLAGSTWPDSVTIGDQDNYGTDWEIGAYIYNSGITTTTTTVSATTTVAPTTTTTSVRAVATTFYVMNIGTASQDNSDINNGGSCDSSSEAMSPVTLNSATFIAGDTIKFCEGTINTGVNATSSGTSGNPITYEPAGDTVIIDAELQGEYCFTIDNKDYITINGLTVKSASDNNFRVVDSDYIKITNNDSSLSLQEGIYFENTTGSEVNYNTMHDNSKQSIYMEAGSSGTLTNNLILYNLFYKNVDDGIILGWYNYTGSGNKIYNNTFYGDAIAGSTGAIIRVSDTEFINNILWNHEKTIRIDKDGTSKLC